MPIVILIYTVCSFVDPTQCETHRVEVAASILACQIAAPSILADMALVGWQATKWSCETKELEL